MKQYLIDFFKYNDWANRQLIDSIKKLPDQDESARLVSHIIASHKKWLNRITREFDDKTLAWFDTPLPVDQLDEQWRECIVKWIGFLEKAQDSQLANDLIFQRPSDGKRISVKIRDVILQINYHSIHHRAQIYRIIRQQGQTPPATDYIFTVLREVQ